MARRGKRLKRLGQALLAFAPVLGVALAAYSLSATHPLGPALIAGFGAATLTAAAGILLWARAVSQPAKPDTGALERQLNRLVARLREINTNSENIDVQDVRQMISAELGEDVYGFLSDQSSLRRDLGERDFAELIGHLNEGHRNLGAAQSASAQGQAEVVWDCLGAAEERLIEAHRLLHLRGQ